VRNWFQNFAFKFNLHHYTYTVVQAPSPTPAPLSFNWQNGSVGASAAPALNLPQNLPIDKIANFENENGGDGGGDLYGGGAVKARAALFGGVQGS
jgi:hypothetical protein